MKATSLVVLSTLLPTNKSKDSEAEFLAAADQVFINYKAGLHSFFEQSDHRLDPGLVATICNFCNSGHELVLQQSVRQTAHMLKMLAGCLRLAEVQGCFIDPKLLTYH